MRILLIIYLPKYMMQNIPKNSIPRKMVGKETTLVSFSASLDDRNVTRSAVKYREWEKK